MSTESRAAVVSIEVDGRQRYIFESDKLQEMLGASRLLDQTRDAAEELFTERGLHLFGPASGEIRAWAPFRQRDALLDAAWELRVWLQDRGIAHTAVYMECSAEHFERDRKEGAVVPESFDAFDEPKVPSLSWVHRALGARADRRKGAKAGQDVSPRCSLFAPCLIHRHEPANWWNLPVETGEDRRKLVSERARLKRKAWSDAKGPGGIFYKLLFEPVARAVNEHLGGDYIDANELRRAIYFRDLASQEDKPDVGGGRDQYMAFICADGDEMGSLLTSVDWNDSRWKDSRTPWQRNREFSMALQDSTKGAFAEAVARTVIPCPKAAKELYEKVRQWRDSKTQASHELPLLPQLYGGDDVWMVADRKIALDLATRFATEYAGRVQDVDVIKNAVRVAGGTHRLSMSAGVAFAKAGHPAHAMAEAAEALLRTAKALRKSRVASGEPGEGCIDWHWIQSSRTEDVRDARRRGFVYRADAGDGAESPKTCEVHLVSRPWTVAQWASKSGESEEVGFRAASRAIEALPSRKLQQLETILRLGPELSLLAWEGWWKGLTKGNQKAFKAAVSSLPEGWQLKELTKGERGFGHIELTPWISRADEPGALVTPLIDLLSLQDVLRRQWDDNASHTSEDAT